MNQLCTLQQIKTARAENYWNFKDVGAFDDNDKLHTVMLSRHIFCPKIAVGNQVEDKLCQWKYLVINLPYNGVDDLQAMRDNSKVQPHEQNVIKSKISTDLLKYDFLEKICFTDGNIKLNKCKYP